MEKFNSKNIMILFRCITIAILLLITYSVVHAQTSKSCECVSIPKSKECWLYCLKYASKKQLTEKLRLDSTTAKNITNLKNRENYSSLTNLQTALPKDISNKLSIIIEKSSVNSVINTQNNLNNGDVINGSQINNNNYYQSNPKENNKKIDRLVTKFDENEIKTRFAESDYRKATELITKISKNFAPYRNFIFAQVFARNLSPVESINYGALLCTQIKYKDGFSIYKYLLKNIDQMPEGNDNDLFFRLSYFMKAEYGDSLINTLIKNQIDLTPNKDKKQLLKILQNKIQGQTATRSQLVYNLRDMLGKVKNTLISNVKDFSLNDSIFLIGVDFMLTYNTSQLAASEYEFDGVLDEVKAYLSNVTLKYNNKGYVVLNFILSDKAAYRTFVVNTDRFRTGRYLNNKPSNLFISLELPCDSINNLCLSKIKEIIPEKVFKYSTSTNDEEIFADAFVLLKNKNAKQGLELIEAHIEKNKKVNYELVYRLIENLVNNGESLPDNAFEIIDKTLTKENTLFEVDVWKGRLLKVKGIAYMYCRYGCIGEKKYLEAGKLAFIQSLTYNPELAESYINLTFIYCIENKFDEAMENVKKATIYSTEQEAINTTKLMKIFIEKNKSNLKPAFKDLFCRSKKN